MGLPLIAYVADLSLYDAVIGLVLIIGILLFASATKRRKMQAGLTHYRYYLLNIYFKIILALLFLSVYQFYYQGGDTIAYYKAAQSMNNLMYSDFKAFWFELTHAPIGENVVINFNSDVGYPPGWIYRDPNSFFISKIYSILMIFTGQTYVGLTIITAWVSSIFSWRIFEIIRSFKMTSDQLGAFAILFIPSVAFWCAGVSKDSIVLIAVFGALYHFFELVNGRSNFRIVSIIQILFYLVALYNIRSFMIFTVGAPLMLSISTRIIRHYQDSKLIANSLRFLILIFGVGSFLLFIRFLGPELAKTTNTYLKEAQVQQQDFLTNESYGEKRYDLGITDFSPAGMIRVAPQAIFTAFYRPGIWEANSPLLLISGIETTVFIYLTLLFLFRGKLRAKLKIIRANEFLVFSFLFAVILAFFAGFTSGLFGVLVRFKAPLLPFLLIVLSTQSIKFNESTDEG